MKCHSDVLYCQKEREKGESACVEVYSCIQITMGRARMNGHKKAAFFLLLPMEIVLYLLSAML